MKIKKLSYLFGLTFSTILLSEPIFAQQAIWGAVGNNQIWRTDVNTGVSTFLTASPFFGQVNSLAYDSTRDIVIYQEDLAQAGIGTRVRMAYYNFATNTHSLLSAPSLNTRTFQAADGAFDGTNFWYIPVGTDDLTRISINTVTNTYTAPVIEASVRNNTEAMDFGDIEFAGNIGASTGTAPRFFISGGDTFLNPRLAYYDFFPSNTYTVTSTDYPRQIARNFDTNQFYGAKGFGTGGQLFFLNEYTGFQVPIATLPFEPSDLTIRPIPEPSSALLLSMLGLGCFVRRRKDG
ncbi:MAG: PEP-CTERM sorting domain-containing protein [Verrucomicrobia bacterium]|nr:MAG: PEP-CTERM sorting domain-containing protein [Verrucomicrobiota bacterium]